MSATWEEAESRWQAEDFTGAGLIFHRLWNAGDAQAGVRYATCLRRAGYAYHAWRISRDVLRCAPELMSARIELAWDAFDAQVCAAQTGHDLVALEHLASEVLDFGAGPAVALTIFAVIEEAKRLGVWQKVNAWCDALNPAELVEANNGTHELAWPLPLRRRWYRAKIKALLMLNQAAGARVFAEQAQAHYPRAPEFVRYGAEALAAQGLFLQAHRELADAVARWPTAWEARTELARLEFQLGRAEVALGQACRAALTTGDDRYRSGLFAFLAELTATHGLFRVAAQHVVLARAWRRADAPYAGALRKLEGRLRAALATEGERFPDVTLDGLAALREQCHAFWQLHATA